MGYRITTDISELLDNPPKSIAFDTETRGNDWTSGAGICITLQISTKPGEGIVLPFCHEYFSRIPKDQIARARDQAKQLLENPEVRCIAHNGKYDIHVLKNEGIEVANFFADTMQLAFVVDDNMKEKSLSACVNRWVPEMTDYSKTFDESIDKGRIWEAGEKELIEYGAADVDATIRLARVLWTEAKKDEKNFQTFMQVQMPALRTLCVMERNGVGINEGALISLGKTMRGQVESLEDEIFSMVKPAVKRKHIAAGISLGRREFVADALFSADGENLTAKVFTKSGGPSTNSKEHLIYFQDNPIVERILEHSKINTLCNNFIGLPQEDGQADLFGVSAPTSKATGMWKHVKPDGRIYPTFVLHGTVTGRVTSFRPNGQQFPKHGQTGKDFRKIFQPSPGFVFLECDLSQAELRIIATMSGDPRMIDAYQNDEDLHAVTAAGNLGITLDEFKSLPPAEKKKHRQAAKGSNFGLCYYQGWRGYQHYVRSAFQVSLSDREAQKLRERYFQTYPKIADWHKKQIRFAEKNGFVRALHG
jgi:DNA polymerase-1